MERTRRTRTTIPDLKQPTTSSLSDFDYELDSYEFDFEEDIKINPDYLDVEFLDFPEILAKYSKESARASKNAKLAEEKVKTIRSMVVKEEQEGTTKHNAVTLEAAYRLDDRYRAAKLEWVNATHYADQCMNLVFALQAKKQSLENLVKLSGQEYFAASDRGLDLSESAKLFREMKLKRTEDKIRELANLRVRG